MCHLRKPSRQPREEGAAVSPILQVWRLRLCEVTSRVQFLRCFLDISWTWLREVLDALGCLEWLISSILATH